MTLTASIAQELVENIGEIAKAGGHDPSSFLANPTVLEIVDSESSNPQERTAALRDLVKKMRWPTITEANAKIAGIRSGMGLPDGIRLDWDRTLERRKVTVSIEVDAQERWRDAIEILGKERVGVGVGEILDEM